MKNIVFASVLCLLMQGCVSTSTTPTAPTTMTKPTTMKLVPKVLNGQKIIVQEDAAEAVSSSQKKSSVALRPPPDGYSLEARPMILVSVYGSGKSFDFSTENIQVFVDGKPHGVMTYDELVEEEKQRQANEITAMESRYAALSRDSAEGAYKSTSDPEVFTPGERDNLVGSTSQGGYTYDVSSVARGHSQINANMQAEKDAIEMRTQAILATLDQLMLKKTTVSPDKLHGGYVAIKEIPDPAQPHEIKIIVTVAGEEHEFLFNHSEVP